MGCGSSKAPEAAVMEPKQRGAGAAKPAAKADGMEKPGGAAAANRSRGAEDAQLKAREAEMREYEEQQQQQQQAANGDGMDEEQRVRYEEEHKEEAVRAKLDNMLLDYKPPRSYIVHAVSKLDKLPYKVLDFWEQWWEQAVPSIAVLREGQDMLFHVTTTLDLQQILWKADGPQDAIVQPLVEFMLTVGAPESEVDRLNESGNIVFPERLGSWIHMSTQGGMDGGWYFPTPFNVQNSHAGPDAGGKLAMLLLWASAEGVDNGVYMSRDMGVQPPRQGELKLPLHGYTVDDRLACAQRLYNKLGVPWLQDPHVQLLVEMEPKEMYVSVVLSSDDDVVRMGVWGTEPSIGLVKQLCVEQKTPVEPLLEFQKQLHVQHAAAVEFQYLMPNFGYGIYREGHTVVLHYDIEPERAA